MPSIPRPLLLALALSGAASLAYEIVWIRLFALELGGTAPALALVLSTFFSGLALGSAIAARRAPRSARPLRAYALLELAIAVLGATSATWIHAALSLSGGARGLAAISLLAPTIAMGATLPFIAAGIRAGEREASRLYAVNTLGAALGAAISGFATIELVGMSGTLVIGSSANLAAAMLAAIARPAASAAAPAEAPASSSIGPRAALALAFVIGAVSIAAEVVLNRLLYMVLGGTTYAITATLAVFLTGIAIGSWLAARFAPRLRDVRAATALGIALLGVSSAVAVRVLLALGEWMRSTAADGPTLAGGLSKSALVALAVLSPPALISGALFPLLVRARGGAGAASLGAVYSVNTLGSIAASLAVTFALVPAIGLIFALTATGLLALASSSAVARTLRGRALAALALAAVAALPYVARIPVGSIRLWLYDALADDRTLDDEGARSRPARPIETTKFIGSGVSTTAAVYETRWPNGKTTLDFAVNGKKEASTDAGSMRNQLVLGHLPMLLHPSPRRALVVGLGAGVTAGAVSVHPGVDVTIAELSPEVPIATRHFAEANHAVLDRANVHLEIADGRRYLAEHRGAGFDVITSDPIHPWVAGAANLYTAEYFALVRDALSENGVAAHWLPLYEMRVADAISIFLTFESAFPRCALWITDSGDSVLIGTRAPLRLEPAAFAARLDSTEVASDLRKIHLDDPFRLLGGLAVGAPASFPKPRTLEAGIFRDDPPALEFRAARSLYRRNTVAENLEAFSDDAWRAEDLAAFLGLKEPVSPRLGAMLHADVAAMRARAALDLRSPRAADAAMNAWATEPDGDQNVFLLEAPGLAERLVLPAHPIEAFVAGAAEARRARLAMPSEPMKAAGLLQRAARLLRSGLAMPQSDAMVERATRRQLAVVLGELRDYAGALEALKPALERAPDDSSLLRVASRAMKRLGRDAEANDALARAASIDLKPAER